jgi:hypothetical protein
MRLQQDDSEDGSRAFTHYRDQRACTTYISSSVLPIAISLRRTVVVGDAVRCCTLKLVVPDILSSASFPPPDLLSLRRMGRRRTVPGP